MVSILKETFDNRGEYAFTGKELAYAEFRPNWNRSFAEYSLECAECECVDNQWLTADGRVPVVACLGAGAGADAAEFKTLGCEVSLVEPNLELLHLAEQRLSAIPKGSARYIQAPALRTGLDDHSVDLLVCAQSIHTMKHEYSAQFLDAQQVQSGVCAEELTRRHWQEILRNDKSRLAIWYYNPDPNIGGVTSLHKILASSLEAYARSKTSFYEAEYFQPNHFQPWVASADLTISQIMPVETVTISRSHVARWLSSYSFAPTDTTALAKVVDELLAGWFDLFSDGEQISVPYVGFIASGPLRQTAYDMSGIADPIHLDDPLRSSKRASPNV